MYDKEVEKWSLISLHWTIHKIHDHESHWLEKKIYFDINVRHRDGGKYYFIFLPAIHGIDKNQFLQCTTQRWWNNFIFLPAIHGMDKKSISTTMYEQTCCGQTDDLAWGINYRGDWNGEWVGLKSHRNDTIGHPGVSFSWWLSLSFSFSLSLPLFLSYLALPLPTWYPSVE